MKCTRCNGKGYLKHTLLINAGEQSEISQCPKCKDIKKYSEAVKKHLAGDPLDSKEEPVEPNKNLTACDNVIYTDRWKK